MTDPVYKTHKQDVAGSLFEVDRELLAPLEREKLYDFLFMQIKNIWRVDGLYFLGLEKRLGTQEATAVDTECWQYMGRVEAQELKKFMGVDAPCGPQEALRLLRHTSWALSHQGKSWQIHPDGSATFCVDHCRTQNIRLDKGLEPHPCRKVREPYLKAFVRELNPALELVCLSCPPERTRPEVWCAWKFRLADK